MPQVYATRTCREDGSPSNWDRYLDLLIRREVPAKFRPWSLRRVEDCLRDLKPTALSALTADQVTDDLRRLSARSDLADWQMRQMVDALRLLLVDLAQVPAGKGVDWDDWWEGQRTLTPEHATIARSTALSAEDGADPTAIGVPRFSRSAPSPSIPVARKRPIGCLSRPLAPLPRPAHPNRADPSPNPAVPA